MIINDPEGIYSSGKRFSMFEPPTSGSASQRPIRLSFYLVSSLDYRVIYSNIKLWVKVKFFNIFKKIFGEEVYFI